MDDYRIELRCKNCGHRVSAHIPKGTTVPAYIETERCGECGCKTFTRQESW